MSIASTAALNSHLEKTLYSEDKPPQVQEDIRSTSMLGLKRLREQANRNYPDLMASRLLEDRAQDDDAFLLQGLADVGVEEERRASVAIHVKAAYPVGVLSINEDPEESWGLCWLHIKIQTLMMMVK